jgi:hypothetical protein
MPRTAIGLGTTVEELARMTAERAMTARSTFSFHQADQTFRLLHGDSYAGGSRKPDDFSDEGRAYPEQGT